MAQGNTSLRILGILLVLFEIWFAFMYGFIYYYNHVTNSAMVDFTGLLVSTFIGILILLGTHSAYLGFGLMTTYIYGFAVTGMVLTFFVLAFSIQYYFIVESFWVKTGLTNDNNIGSFNEQDFFTLGLSNRNDRVLSSNIVSSSLQEAMAMGLSLIVAMFAVLGRTGPLECFLLVVVGGFIYTFNEAIFWRIAVADAGFCGRIFVFGSTLGLVSSLILWKKELTKNNHNYHSNKSYQTLAFLGTVFVWVFIPALNVVNQLFKVDNIITGSFRSTYAQVAPLNIFLALSASTLASYCISMGAVAFGASSDLTTNSFPPLLVGFTAGIASSLTNTLLKKRMNAEGVIDSQGVLFSFLIPGIIGMIYSAIIAAIDTSTPGDTGRSMVIANRSFNGQGGIQMAGLGIALGCGALAGLLVGLLYKVSNVAFQYDDDEFNDQTFIKFDSNAPQEDQPVPPPANARPVDN